MLLLLAILFILIHPISIPPDPNIARVAEPKVKAAMKYHGIRFAEDQLDGPMVFYRDNKKCQLFTKSFEEYWRKKNASLLKEKN
jgi:hypothetical protein